MSALQAHPWHSPSDGRQQRIRRHSAHTACLAASRSALARTRQLSEASADALRVGFVQGVALQFVNIKAWMLALAIVSGWIAGQDNPALRFAWVLPVMLFYAFSSNLTYALVGSLLRHWLAGPDGTAQRLRWFNRCMAGVLAATGVWMLLR